MRPSIRSFLQDQRGAIAVLSTFMAATLVGMTWYIMGTGDAIVYRERMQDASDASVYAAAVYHARGMNIIAMFNIIMAAIIAVLIICKILMIFGNILQALGFIPFIGAALASAGTLIYNTFNAAANIIQRVADAVIPILDKAQVALARVMPIAAEAKAIWIASDYKPAVKIGLMVSPTILQGLPVEADKKSRICEKAAKYVADLVTTPIPSFARDYVSDMITKLISALGAYFCGDASNIDLGNLGGDLADKQCDEAKEGNQEKLDCAERQTECTAQYNTDMARNPPKPQAQAAADRTQCNQSGACNRPESRPGYVHPDGRREADGDKDFNKEKCKQDKAKEINDQAGRGATGGNKANGVPKKVKAGIENGFSSMQIYSVSFGDTKFADRAKGGVQIADWNRGNTDSGGFHLGRTLGPTLGKFSFARGEFYFDCIGLWAEAGCNGDGKIPNAENAMWNLRWRARLRRVSSTTLVGPDLGNFGEMIARVQSAIPTSFTDLAGSATDLVDGVGGAACTQLPALCGGGGGGIMGIVTGQLDGVVSGLVESVLNNAGGQTFLDAAAQVSQGLGVVEDTLFTANSALLGGAIGIMH